MVVVCVCVAKCPKKGVHDVHLKNDGFKKKVSTCKVFNVLKVLNLVFQNLED